MPEKKMIGDEMVGRHHQFNGIEFDQAVGIADGQRSLVCCSPCYTESQTILSD